MESQNMDNQFKKIIESSEDHYKEYSEKARSYTWHEINKGKNMYIFSLWKRMAVAATILLLLSISLSLYYSKKQSDALVTSLYSQMELLKKESIAQKQEPETIIKTVTVERKRTVKVPVMKTEIIERIKYIKDTIYVKQIMVEYIENEKEKNLVKLQDNSDQEINEKDKSTVQTEFILTGNTIKKKKEPFSLEKFLNKRYENKSNSESGSIMSITAKL